MPYSSTAEAMAPSRRYFKPASLERRSLWKPTRMYCEMLVSSSATKIPMRSRVPASSMSPAVLKSSSARYSPAREGMRPNVSQDAPITASAIPASKNWKNRAKWSSTRMSSKALRPALPSASNVAL